MRNVIARCIGLGVALVLCKIAASQNLTVTSPSNGSFLGLTNQIKFSVTNANVEVTIAAKVTGPGGVTNISDRFTPDVDGKIDAQLQLNFSEASPSGAYTIEVTGKRNDDNTVFGTVNLSVTVDVKKPKFLHFNPIENSFVKGIVPIRVTVDEPNFKDFRVQINSQDIPNNTGDILVNNGFEVFWDTGGITLDGPQTITIRLRDLAQNEENRSIGVRLDRIPPSVTIIQPQPNVTLRARTNVSVAIDVLDATGTSVDVTGVDVIARTLGGVYLARVARDSFRSIGSNTMRWTGRLRWRSLIPSQCKLVVNVIDKAGNVATQQEIIVKFK